MLAVSGWTRVLRNLFILVYMCMCVWCMCDCILIYAHTHVGVLYVSMHMPVDADNQGQLAFSLIAIFALFILKLILWFCLDSQTRQFSGSTCLPPPMALWLQTPAIRPGFCIGVEYMNQGLHALHCEYFTH